MMESKYKKRVILALIFFIVLYGIVLVRLFFIQVYQHEFFTSLGSAQYNVSIKLEPPRAAIMDKNGVLLAINKQVLSAFVLPHQLKEPKKTMAYLLKHYPAVHQRIVAHPERYFFWVERRLSQEREEYLKSQDCADLNFVAEYRRWYPFPEMASVIGMTDIDNQGIAGLELHYNKQLAGEPTTYSVQKDARSNRFYFQKTVNKKGLEGINLQTTLDKKLQFLVYEELKNTVEHFEAKRGAVMVLDPYTGAIEAMVNYPAFDPNGDIPADLSITRNIAIAETYELGSVLKAFSALAGLAEGAAEYDELFDWEGKSAYINGFRVENPKAVGVIPFYDVVRYSSNVGLAKVADRLGSKLYDHLQMLGFGTKTGIDFPGERSGFVNPPNRWSRSSVLVMSFGYEITMTLLQLACAGSVFANGGYKVQPHFIVRDSAAPLKKLNYSEKTLQELDSILTMIAQRHKVKGFNFKGKTGTARMVDNGQYSTQKHLYTFMGIAEREGYKRVVVSFVQEPKKAHLWAADVAAPLAMKVVEKLALTFDAH